MSIELKNVSYVYQSNAAKQHYAVEDVSFTIEKGEFIGVIGHTGSGKSTMIQFMNGLLKPTSGQILFDGQDVFAKDYPIKKLRQKVGLVFQYPEHQLFEADVFTDVCFGPKNLGLPKEEIKERARRAMNMVGLDESYDEKSPFELSGGEKRRVAIAGILAMDPEYLILDEPTAGLDPQGRDEILSEVSRLNKEEGLTVILVSHSMDDVAMYADRLLVMNNGELAYDDTPENVFKNYAALEKIGLSAPQITYVCQMLKAKGFPISDEIYTVKDAKEAILKALKK